MAKQKKGQTQEVTQLTGLDRLGLRVSAMIQSPRAQLARSVLIYRLETDADEDWDQVMGLLNETDGLHLVFDDEGNVQVSWEAGEGEGEGGDAEEPEQLRRREPITEAEIPF